MSKIKASTILGIGYIILPFLVLGTYKIWSLVYNLFF
jgi:hypothetical protein